MEAHTLLVLCRQKNIGVVNQLLKRNKRGQERKKKSKEVQYLHMVPVLADKCINKYSCCACVRACTFKIPTRVYRNGLRQTKEVPTFQKVGDGKGKRGKKHDECYLVRDGGRRPKCYARGREKLVQTKRKERKGKGDSYVNEEMI